MKITLRENMAKVLYARDGEGWMVMMRDVWCIVRGMGLAHLDKW